MAFVHASLASTLAVAISSFASGQNIGGRAVAGPFVSTSNPPAALGTACTVLGQCPFTLPFANAGGTTWAGTFLWQGNFFGAQVIEKIDPQTCAVVASIPAPEQYIGGLAWDGTSLWACAEEAGMIYQLDPNNGNVLSVIPAPGLTSPNPDSAGLAWDGQALWHTDYGLAQIYRLDPSNGNVLQTFAAPGFGPSGIAYSGGVLLVSDFYDDRIYQVNASTGATLSSCLSPGTHPWGLAVSITGSTWNADSNAAALFELDTGFTPTQPIAYCTAGTSSHGCVPAIQGSAQPSASGANACVIQVTTVEGQRAGLIFYGIDNTGFTPLPWGQGTSFFCTKQPTLRSLPRNSGGTINTCSGQFTLDWNAFQSANPGALGQPWTVGDKVFLQAWYRDPPAPKTTNLSDALELVYQP